MSISKLRWGILSTARIARHSLIPAIQNSRNGQVVALASRRLETARQCAQAAGIPRAYGSYEELLADPEVDAVYLPLPNSLHAEWSLRCVEHGKHVLCEKPLAASAEQGRTMAAAFSSRQLILGEAFMYRYHPVCRTFYQMVREGRIGALRSMRATFLAEIPTGDVRYQRALAGGAMRDLGCYCSSVMRLLAGEEPIRVEAVGKLLNGVDIHTAGLLAFPSGVIGYFCCGMDAPFECSYEAFGASGRLRVDYGGMVTWPGAKFVIQHWWKGKYEEITCEPANHYQLLVEDFADCLQQGRPFTWPLSDSIGNLEVIDRVLRAIGAE